MFVNHNIFIEVINRTVKFVYNEQLGELPIVIIFPKSQSTEN